MNKKRSTIVKVLIGIFFFASVILPLFQMLIYIRDVDIIALIVSDSFVQALKNSIYSSVTASLISISIAFLLSWVIMRTNIRFKSIFSIILTLPMLIPSISHGMGLVLLFGTNGIITNFLNTNVNIYGFWGIVVGSVLYSFPIAFLMISDILKYEDSTPYDAAEVLGFSAWDKLKAITLPYIRKPMISVVFATFTLIVTDYGVPLMIGGKFTTLPVIMYQEVVGRLDFNKGGVIGLVLLLPTFIAFIIDLLNKDMGNVSFNIKKFNIKDNKIRNMFSYLFVIVTIFLISLPIFVFILLTFSANYPVNMSFSLDNIINTLNMNLGRYLLNSLIISFSVATIGTIIAYITGYLTVRIPDKISRIIHLFAISSLAIPGIVLGLAYVITFNQTAVYGTLAILILVNLVHFFASPYLMIYNTFGKINSNLEAVGTTLGIGRLRMIKDIFIPQTIGTIMEMFSYFFVNSMITISAVSFLSSIGNKPLSLLINQFEGNMMIESSAFVSLIILVVNMIMKSLVGLIKRSRSKKGLV